MLTFSTLELFGKFFSKSQFGILMLPDVTWDFKPVAFLLIKHELINFDRTFYVILNWY